MSPLTSTLTSTPSPPPPPDAPINLAAHYLTTYRSIFYHALYDTPNKVQPFLIPFCLVGAFLLPIAFLCIPQYSVVTTTTGGANGERQQVRVRREWVHRLRWVVGAVIVWWNLGVVVGLPGFGGLGLGSTEGGQGWFTPGTTTASACTALSYAAGLMGGWGTIWGLETVVFGGYQGVAMRVRRRVRTGRVNGQEEGVEGELKNGIVNGNLNTETNGNGNGNPDTANLRRRNLKGSGKVASSASTDTEMQSPGENEHKEKGKRWTVDETIDLDKYEYYWEPYPDNGTFWERLDWVMDMFNSFRGAGWNYSISSIPSLQPPIIPPLPESTTPSSSSSSSSHVEILPYFPTGLPVSFANLPLSSHQHFHRPLTARSFLLSRLQHIIWSYLALDFFTVSARLDPYFILGPNGPLRHPTYLSTVASSSSSPSVLPPLSLACARFLASLPPWGLNFFRSLFSLSGVLGGLFLYSYLWQLTQFFVLGRWLRLETHGMGILDELWRYPDLFGGFVRNVLDRGLAGFWGGWWHQSFRVGFTGPVRFLVKQGILGMGKEKEKGMKNKKVVATAQMATAFLLSGFLHALGGYSSTAFRISFISPSPDGEGEEDLLTGDDKRNRLARFAEPVGFFVFQFLGCLVQALLISLVKRVLKRVTVTVTVTGGRKEKEKEKEKEVPRWLKRTGNGVFVLLWLHNTRWMLIDDMARSGLFLYEPVPISVFRLLGLGGMPGEGRRWDWWRLDWEYVPSLWRGSRWWEVGFRM
ncbi:hypothetical protein NEUTE1DRAFT_93246 [Neurospora tetrasperma FGSC 2508]|uniref:Wax synthase domain-containing protein n=1 Tax=Neurospora tetrasperma (strain FGSC 2508 / ATCC MYA-4615 / P0657) TaxID=510951 RepID=F8MZK0_NEUT8|nr:uncharacterized protein NEUTE1DRAFT_93246 [Neurospora tetrasperma FGSC 2508]EGO53690.1 hypothetical protein NEUTE1DRAFT_93246 [Neurospora tetrasperma FGSC 2508]